MYTIKKEGLRFNYPYKLTLSLISDSNYNNISKNKFLLPEYIEKEEQINEISSKPNKYIKKLIKDKENLIKNNQRKKVDLLIEKAYDRYNNYIRTYNFNSIYKNERKNCDYLPKITKNNITSQIITKTQRLFPSKYISKGKCQHYSELIKERKKKQDFDKYKQIYRIKYINTDYNEKVPRKNIFEDVGTQVNSIEISNLPSRLSSVNLLTKRGLV